MWIVRVALDRPYTFIVLALLILLLSPVMILRTPTDIFPNINIPVVAVAWQYTGMNPEELEGRLTSVYERVLTALVDNVELSCRRSDFERSLGREWSGRSRPSLGLDKRTHFESRSEEL